MMVAPLAMEAGKRIGGNHPVRRTIASFLILGASLGGALDGFGLHLQARQSVTAGKGVLKTVSLTDPKVCGSQLVAHVSGDKATWKYGPFNALSYSASYSGDLAAEICIQQNKIVANWDLAKQKYVAKISEKDAVSLILSEVKQGEGFNSDNSFIGAELANMTNLIKAIPGLDSKWVDGKYNSLRNIALLEADRVVASTCGPLAVKQLTDANASKQNLQSGLNAPNTIQSQLVQGFVNSVNMVESMTHITFTPSDFEVDIDTNAVSLSTQYDAEIAAIQAHKPDHLSLPNIKDIPACVNAVGSGKAG